MADISLASDIASSGETAKARALRGRKQRILWDSDNATPDGKTSIGVLLEWLTAPGNYERWQDGKAQFGETREKLCTEINTLLKKNGIFHRENANIRTQISEQERSYDAAVAWLVQNGFDDGQLPPESQSPSAAGVAHGGGDSSNAMKTDAVHLAEAHVIRLCRYFHVLSAIMRQPSNQPRARRAYHRSSSSASSSRRAGSDGPKEDDLTGDDDEFAMETSSENGAESALGGAAAAAGTTETLLQKRKAQWTSAAAQPPKLLAASSSSTASAAATAASVAGSSASTTPSVMMTPTSFASFENTQRMLLDAAREDRERKRFQLDEERTKLECEKLRYEVQLKKIELAVQRVVARKQLLGSGMSLHEIDALLATPPTLP